MSQISQEIDAAAADWVARLDKGTLSGVDEQSLEAWLSQDTRHRGAFMRMRAIAAHTERARALGPNFDPARFVPQVELRHPRRKTVWIAAAAAAAGLAALVLLPALMSGERYETRRGEVRVVSLEDGSVLTLNTATQAEIEFNDAVRKIRLLEGEAIFEVAKESSRPFIVDAGNSSVRALGTSFSVRRLEHAPIQVIVRDGLVEVKPTPEAAPIRIAANMRATVPVAGNQTTPAPSTLSPEAVGRELAWRDGRVAFEAESLADAAATFARYSATQIVIEDPAIAQKEITGLFTANDPVSFARAAAASLGLTVEIADGEVRLSR